MRAVVAQYVDEDQQRWVRPSTVPELSSDSSASMPMLRAVAPRQLRTPTPIDDASRARFREMRSQVVERVLAKAGKTKPKKGAASGKPRAEDVEGVLKCP